jgi:DNA-binding NtrC family response regulator
MTHRAQSVQIISVASRAIDALVSKGEFLEGLFSRLSVVRLDTRYADQHLNRIEKAS